MANKKIQIVDQLNRDVEINYEGFTPKKQVFHVDPDKEEILSKKYVKATALEEYDELLKKYNDIEGVAEAIMKEDPEINLELVGKFAESSNRVYINTDNEIVFDVKRTKTTYNPIGEVIEVLDESEVQGTNSTNENALNWSGKYFKKNEIYNKFVFLKKQQLKHTNPSNFDMLYAMAKDLHEKESLMLIGKKTETPTLTFKSGGKEIITFLEGRIKGNGYKLILHSSNMELKALQTK